MKTILEEHNLHWKNKNAYSDLIPREDYVQQLLKLRDRNEIVALKGIRRSGKSSLFKLFIRSLIKKGVNPKNILMVNLEDYRFGSEKNYSLLESIVDQYLMVMKPKGKIFFFFDEIQVVNEFEKWIRTQNELKSNYKIFISGSSSSLLSGELSALLTGRHFSVNVSPFSFKEFVFFKDPSLASTLKSLDFEKIIPVKNQSKLQNLLESYLFWGGFPEIIKSNDPETNTTLLQQYVDDILYKDIINRYNVRKIKPLQSLIQYLISNMANEIRISRISNLLNINRMTVTDLLYYLNEVYLIYLIGNFSFSLNERLNSKKPRKVYCIDNGIFNAFKQTSSPDLGKRSENLVFQQLYFQWKEEVFFWKSKVEVDFVLNNGLPINVHYSDSIEDRELNGLLYYLEHHNLDKGILISKSTWDVFNESQKRIYIIPLWFFLFKSKAEILGSLD